MMTRSTTGTACAVAVLLASAAARADTIFGLYAGAGKWQQEYAGEVVSGAEQLDVDLERDLDLDDERNTLLYLALEHPIPVLPNLRFNHTDISTSGENVLSETITFRGETFQTGDSVASDLELTQTDVVGYYELLDNVVSLDLGIGARWVEGHMEVVSTAGAGRADFDGALPMLYGRARIDLPLTGFWAGADAMGIAYDDHRLLDLSAQLGWQSRIGLGAELGWRRLDLELDDVDDIDSADVEIEGPYAAINFHF